MKADHRQSTAYHEAGHAVVAYRFDHDAGDITIKPDPERGSAGCAQTEGPWIGGSTDREQIMVLFAGYESELILHPDANREGSQQDEAQAANLLRFHPTGTENELRLETKKILHDNWRQVEAIATALLEDETLEDDEWGIIIDAIDEGENWRDLLARLRINKGSISEHNSTAS